MPRVADRQSPVVMVIDFHHARGPEIEVSISDEGTDPAAENDWSLLPFMALSDGAHTSVEEFSYFTLYRKESLTQPAASLFGISCSRQIESKLLKNRPPDVTRSTVQKAVVVVTDIPQSLGQLRQKLSMVTSAWFAQRDLLDIDILKKFRESLVNGLKNEEEVKAEYLGLSLRELIHEFKYQTLVMFKSLLLQPKMLFFGSRCERLCMMQFSLISLIPGLMDHLEDCADPSFDNYAENVRKPTSLKTSERSSLLAYMGLPLQIFGRGSMFSPYTPLQQLDLLADFGTKSYVVGSTNSLLLQQKDRYSDILINLDDITVNTSSSSLRSALSLSAADRRWIDFITQAVNDTWDDAHPDLPKTHGYMGSEEFIRLQFEEYLLALLSCMKYHEELDSCNTGESGGRSQSELQAFNIEGDPALEFNSEFLAQWRTTSNYALFQQLTSDALLYSIVEPRHPCAGGLTIEDIQRRIAQQIAELHLDERVREGREALNRQLALGQQKVSAAFNSFWTDIEAMREAQRIKNEEKAAQSPSQSTLDNDDGYVSLPVSETEAARTEGFVVPRHPRRNKPSVDLTQAQASVSAMGQRASAYFSSWATWAGEKKKEWQEKKTTPGSHSPISTPSTPILNDVTESVEFDAEKPQQPTPRHSEELPRRARDTKKKNRWSSIILRGEENEPVSVREHRNQDSDEGGKRDDSPMRSPLRKSKTVHEAQQRPHEDDEKEPATTSEETPEKINHPTASDAAEPNPPPEDKSAEHHRLPMTPDTFEQVSLGQGSPPTA